MHSDGTIPAFNIPSRAALERLKGHQVDGYRGTIHGRVAHIVATCTHAVAIYGTPYQSPFIPLRREPRCPPRSDRVYSLEYRIPFPPKKPLVSASDG